MYNQYIILASAKPGREQEFDDWYVWVHTHDVMSSRAAAISAQCFRRTDADLNQGRPTRCDQSFLCLYENSDPVGMTGTLQYENGQMLISSAVDQTAPMGGGYYDTVAERHKSPGQWPDAGAVIEWIEGAAAEDIERYIDVRFPSLMKHAAILSGWVGKASAHQIFDNQRAPYLAIYRCAAFNAAGAIWDAAAKDLPRSGNISAAFFEQISARLTRIALLTPSDEQRELAQHMRELVVRREKNQTETTPSLLP
jgi:hypothetical protein